MTGTSRGSTVTLRVRMLMGRGSRFRKWRWRVSALSTGWNTDSAGQFPEHADDTAHLGLAKGRTVAAGAARQLTHCTSSR